MRITGGIYGGRVLEAPKDRTIRPTSDKVRQAIFNILNARGLVQDAVVLDAFCGTGALGIEALSWGALCCTFMDRNGGSLGLAKKNFAALKINAQHSFILKDAAKPGRNPHPENAATLAFLDPPYKQDLIALSLPVLVREGWVRPDAFILLECEKSYDLSCLVDHAILMERSYGDTRIALVQPRG